MLIVKINDFEFTQNDVGNYISLSKQIWHAIEREAYKCVINGKIQNRWRAKIKASKDIIDILNETSNFCDLKNIETLPDYEKLVLIS